MADLSLSFAGIPFKNPFILASAPPTLDAVHIIKAARMGWGGAVTKTISTAMLKDVRPRLAALREGRKVIGMTNIELVSTIEAERWCTVEIPAVKKQSPKDFVLIASIMASADPGEWAALACRVESAGADMIEFPMACRNEPWACSSVRMPPWSKRLRRVSKPLPACRSSSN
ncbi:MAG: hypothetical protein M0009_17060 [Deltaproteobacteria bacterium]|nr:hypothetical protein [Deltaproteobacteria bacterium]